MNRTDVHYSFSVNRPQIYIELPYSGSVGGGGGEGGGADGFSPIVSVSPISGGYHVTITDKYGLKEFDLFHGNNGADGQNGQDGTNGRDGIDGVSPTISVAAIENGTRVTITDVNGSRSFDVMNGTGGSGEGGGSVYVHPLTHPASMITGLDDFVDDIVYAHNADNSAHSALLAGKVDKVSGKGLSTNDYTSAEKSKLAGIAANANNYTHPSTHAASMITGLAAVATTGNYANLVGIPTDIATMTFVLNQIEDCAPHKVGIDGSPYTLRTGADGAAGYITFVLE